MKTSNWKWIVALTLWLTATVLAGDISPGVTWSDDESSPNSLVNSNRLTAFLGDATLKTNAIVDRTEITSTATNDFVLLYDASTNELRKTALANLLPATSVTTAQLGTNIVTAINLASNAVQSYHLLTNIADAITANTDLAVNMADEGGTNIFFLTFRSTSASTNHVPTNAVTAITPLETVAESAVMTTAIQTVVTNYDATNRFVSGEFALATGRTSTNHALGVTPSLVRWVLVCKTNDAGYSAGEEIDVDSVEDSGLTATPQYATGADSTNVFIVGVGANITGPNGSTGAQEAFTETRWRMKCYARP